MFASLHRIVLTSALAVAVCLVTPGVSAQPAMRDLGVVVLPLQGQAQPERLYGQSYALVIGASTHPAAPSATPSARKPCGATCQRMLPD
jgi:hypothetical protein